MTLKMSLSTNRFIYLLVLYTFCSEFCPGFGDCLTLSPNRLELGLGSCVAVSFPLITENVPQRPRNLNPKTDKVIQKLKMFAGKDAVIILDGDNIRGKTRFKLSKEGTAYI